MSNAFVNNIFPHTFALPDELLLEIFKINAEHYIYLPRAHIKDTIACSQVCRQWRHVSLASSALWERCLDYCLGKDWIEEILRRTGNQLLQIIYPSFTSYLDEKTAALDTLRNQQQRYGHAACDLTDVLIDRLPKCMVYEGEHLPKDRSVFERCRSLSLILDRAGWNAHYPFLARHLVCIKNITLSCMDPLSGFSPTDFEDSAPWCAETLHLRNISLPLHLARFQKLRCLTVSDLKLEAHKLTVAGWLRVLEHMPELRVLRLNDAIVDEDSRRARSASNSVIALPHLECLIFDCAIDEASALLRGLAFPNSCRTFPTIFMSQTNADFSKLCSFLEAQYAMRSQTGYHTIQVELERDSCHICIGCMADHGADSSGFACVLDIDVFWPRAGQAALFSKLLVTLRKLCGASAAIFDT
ncbi:hypothetical protein HYPSUDRAFT_402233 [Hypholoma sublateritium FD-334 SS-4]|uniref:F-box domain-containing protein n=1 Tax=Hypholoma sublateritium (strain FD-334 SS-4) TaxID=945553 RepID=A0A0D2LDI7_HYPSF|nr:hypothetical protein HYPSUDRAFT_402233 [Hypholoma sublateritium FD-334 SS-4]